MGLLDTPGFSRGQTKTRFDRLLRPNGSRVAFIGTSLSSLYSDATSVYPPHKFPSWPNRLCWESNGKLLNVGYFAVPGATTQQIHDSQLPSVLALDPKPAACFIECGANEAGSGATTTFKNLVIDMVAQLRAAGIVPILVLSPPRGEVGSSGSSNAIGIAAQNEWRSRYAEKNGILTIDAYAPIVDVTGGIAAAYTASDTTHLNEAGYAKVASDAATRQKVYDLFPFSRPIRGRSKVDAQDLWTGRCVFTGSSAPNWTGLAGGTSTMTLTFATPTTDEDVPGQWLIGTRSAGTGDAVLQGPFIPAASLPAMAGKRIAIAFAFKTSGLQAGAGSFDLSIRFNSTVPAGDVYRTIAQAVKRDISGTFYHETTIPVGPSGSLGANLLVTSKPATGGGSSSAPIVFSIGAGKIIDLDAVDA